MDSETKEQKRITMEHEEGNVVKRARERIAKGQIDGEYVLLLAREVERGRKMVSKLQNENYQLYMQYVKGDSDDETFD
jgi:hypothetical protein